MTPSLLVVSGTQGIGLEIARRYAGEGWSVVVAGRDGARAKSVAAEARRRYARHRCGPVRAGADC